MGDSISRKRVQQDSVMNVGGWRLGLPGVLKVGFFWWGFLGREFLGRFFFLRAIFLVVQGGECTKEEYKKK
jgi:hypothetical protein